MAGSYIRIDGTNMAITRDGPVSTGHQSVSLSTGGSTTLTDAQQATDAIEFTGALTSNATVNFTLKAGACYKIINSCTSSTPGYNVTVKVTGQTGVVVENGKTVYVVCHASDLVMVGTDPVALGIGLERNNVAITVTAANRNITRAEALYGSWTCTGSALTATRDLILPDLTKRFIFIRNQTDQHLRVIGASGTGVTVGVDKAVLVYVDGTNVVPLTPVSYGMPDAGTALSGSNAETVLGSFAIGQSMINKGTVIRIRFQGRASSTVGTDTLTVRLRFGTTTLTGTALLTIGPTDVANNDVWTGFFELTARSAAGATVAIVGSGHYSALAAAGGNLLSAVLAPTNFATNGVLLVEVTGQWSTTNANSCILEQLNVEIR